MSDVSSPKGRDTSTLRDPVPKLSWSPGVKRELAEDEDGEEEVEAKGREGGRRGVAALLGAALFAPSVVANLDAMGRSNTSRSGIGGTGSTTVGSGIGSDFLRREKNRERPFGFGFPLEDT